MRILLLMAILAALILPLLPASVLAASAVTVVITANPTYGGNSCVSNFNLSVSFVDPLYHVQLSWTPAVEGNGTKVVVGVGEWPGNCTDNVIYDGNGTSTTHVVLDVDDLIDGVFYKVYNVLEGNCSSCYASGSVIAQEQEATGIGNFTGNITNTIPGLDDIGGLLRVGLVLGFSTVIGLIGAIRHSLTAYLVGIVGTVVSLSYVNDEIGVYLTMPMIILIVGLLFGAIIDKWKERLIII